MAVLTLLQVEVPKVESQRVALRYLYLPVALGVVGVCARVVQRGQGATLGTQNCVSATVAWHGQRKSCAITKVGSEHQEGIWSSFK